MLVYFAHPIDQAQRGVASVSDIVQTLHACGVSIYRPGGAFTLAASSLPDLSAVQQINSAALDRADALVAWLPSGVATLGVPAEIETALRLGKPTVILVEAGLFARSVQLQAWLEAGASVETWGDATARRWERMPILLSDLLRTNPDRELVDASAPSGQAESTPGREFAEDRFGPSSHPKLAWTGPGKLTQGHYPGDAGIDLAISEDTHLASGEYKLIPTGVKMAIPEGYFGMITGRSSTWGKHHCRVVLSIIDSGYRGQMMIGIKNEGVPVMFEAGTRLGQIIILPTFGGELVQVDSLTTSHRGEAGYGSSGK